MDFQQKLRTILKFGSLTYSQKKKEYIFTPSDDAYRFMNTKIGYDLTYTELSDIVDDVYDEIIQPNNELI